MTRRASIAAVAAAAVVVAGSVLHSQGDRRPAAADAGTFTLAMTGDSIITRKLSAYEEPSFRKLVDMLRGADAAFTNLEMLLHDYEPYPAHESGGTWMR